MKLTFDNIKNASFDGVQLKFLGEKKAKGNVPHQKDDWILRSYKSLFGGFRPKSILEVGINTGGSLNMWNKLFGCKVVGIDITLNNVGKPAKDYIERHPEIQMHRCNSKGKERIDKIMKAEFPNGADLIIDDGDHSLGFMVPTFQNLWEHTNSLYVVEDWKALGHDHRVQLLGKLSSDLIGYWPNPDPGKGAPWKLEVYKRLIGIWRKK